jgi:hypothetical protein
MLNDELNKYKEMYSLLVEQFVFLHNRNMFFIENTETARPHAEVRKILSEIHKLTKVMKNQTKLVHQEGLENLREERRLNRETKKRQIGRYNPRKKKENNNDNNSATTNTV